MKHIKYFLTGIFAFSLMLSTGAGIIWLFYKFGLYIIAAYLVILSIIGLYNLGELLHDKD